MVDSSKAFLNLPASFTNSLKLVPVSLVICFCTFLTFSNATVTLSNTLSLNGTSAPTAPLQNFPDNSPSLSNAPTNLSKLPLSNAILISCVTSAISNLTFLECFLASVIAEFTAPKIESLR